MYRFEWLHIPFADFLYIVLPGHRLWLFSKVSAYGAGTPGRRKGEPCNTDADPGGDVKKMARMVSQFYETGEVMVVACGEKDAYSVISMHGRVQVTWMQSNLMHSANYDLKGEPKRGECQVMERQRVEPLRSQSLNVPHLKSVSPFPLPSSSAYPQFPLSIIETGGCVV
ncbi:hypothetical protein M426DRAFT_164108 [Hypoxylon sp. CI-4A]|nr:hypothetical protein M426DRAFT_164108 [Hypoxylon sp. CI-4A]